MKKLILLITISISLIFTHFYIKSIKTDQFQLCKLNLENQQDVQGVCNLISGTEKESFHCCISNESGRNNFIECQADTCSKCYVVKNINGTICGAITYKANSDDCVFIMLILHTSYIKQEVATMLLQAVESECAHRKEVKQLGVIVPIKNSIVLESIQKCGFVAQESINLSKSLKNYTQFHIPILPDIEIKTLDKNNKQEMLGVSDLSADKDVLNYCGELNAEMYEHVIIAKSHDGTVCGVVMYQIKDDYAWIHKLATHKDYQRCGIGTVLMQTVQNRCFVKNVETLVLCVDFDNTKAIHFYHKLGFFEELKTMFKNL